MGLKEQVIKEMIQECVRPLLDLQKKFEKQGNRVDEITEDTSAEKYPSVSAVINFVKAKNEALSEAFGKAYLKITDFDFYKKSAADSYATKTDVEDLEKTASDTYATKTTVEDLEKSVADVCATKTEVNNLKENTEVTKTATGSAIAIESSQAPLQNLKLFGKTEQDGIPTPDNPIELKSIGDSGSYSVDLYGKNIFDIGTENDWFLVHNSGLTLFQNYAVSNRIELNITNETITFESYNTNGWFWLGKFIDLAPNTTYTINADTGYSIAIAGANSNAYETVGTQLCLWLSSNKIPKTFDSGDYAYYWISIYPNSAGTTYSNIQIEIGTQATPYEPYKAKQSITFTDTLRGVGDIKDEVNFARSVKIQRINEVELDGLDDGYWLKSQYVLAGGNRFDFTSSLIPQAKNINCICDGFQAVPTANEGTDTCWCNYTVPNTFEFRIITNRVSTVEELIAMLQDNPIKVQYELAEPIETPISESELNAYRQLMTNEGATTILSEAEAEVDYYINKPNAQAIGNIHSQLNKDYFKLQQAIIETGGN